jgi:hypothetical protein
MHLQNDRSATLSILQSRFGLLTNDLVNEGIDKMKSVIFPRVSRASTPTTPTLPENFAFEDFDKWSLTPPPATQHRDSYENEIHKEGLNLPQIYFEGGGFPYVPRQAADVPAVFTKSGKTMTSQELCNYYAAHNVFVYLN